MMEFGIPKKLTNLTKATLTDTKCKILINNTQSDPFDIDTGARQGDKLSTILFNLALEKVARAMSINWEGTIFYSSKQMIAFADDTDLIGRGTFAVKESFVEMDMEASNVGLLVNENKTKYMTLDRKSGSRVGQNITMDNYNFEVVQSFKYLGSILNVTNDIEEEIKVRITQGNRCFFALKHLFRSSLVSRATKLRLYKTIIRPIVMYGSETWPLATKLEKLIETVVKNQLMKYINENDLLSLYQSAYRMNHSCETALNLVLAKWKEIGENGDTILAVFLDLKRAFETIDRKRLLAKLRKLGCSQRVVTWFAGYLDGRKQQTKVNGHTSEQMTNDLGVPQGSVLGAILFVLYVNDMPRQLLNAFINLFADDTLIYLHGNDIDAMRNEMNNELERINQWLKLNKLKLNVSKTKVMVLGNTLMKSPLNSIIMDGEVLGIEREFKYLGVMLDEKLSFKANLDYLCKKVGKKVGVLARLARNITIGARMNIYKSVIAPHFDYCASILYLSDVSSFDRMQKLQNRALRAILRCKKLTPIKEMLEALDLLSVRQRVNESTMKFIYKLKNGQLPRYLSEMVTYRFDIHTYPTRSRNDFMVACKTSEKSRNSVFHKGLVQFNSLPGHIKNETRKETFKNNLRQFVKENL